MSSPEQVAGLLAAAKDRHDGARRRAVSALRDLDTAGTPVNIASVARAAGVSRSWLYRQTDLRTTIENLRQGRPDHGRRSIPAAQRATTDSLGHQLEALRARCAELQAENRQLREAVARKLGQQRSDPSAER